MRELPPMDYEPHGIPQLERFGEYRVPWFVTLRNEKDQPEFRVLDPKRFAEALRRQVCWVCGEPLHLSRFSFAIGSMCAVNRISPEPPQHEACSIYAAMHCPFLSDPSRIRRSGGMVDEGLTSEAAILRNPGVTCIWVTKRFTRFRGAGTDILHHMDGRPRTVWWIREGRLATRAEVEHSIETGFPILLDAAKRDGPDAVDVLYQQRRMAEHYFPDAP